MKVITGTSPNPSNPNDQAHPPSSPAHPPRPSNPQRLSAPTPKSSTRHEYNTFEESFRAALHQPPITDGTTDYNPYDEHTPLLNSLYNPTNPHPTTKVKPHRLPHQLTPPKKSKPSLSISLWHEICHNSQYTRPAAEILREVLEERYPVSSPSGEVEDVEALLGNERVGRRRRWWRSVLRR